MPDGLQRYYSSKHDDLGDIKTNKKEELKAEQQIPCVNVVPISGWLSCMIGDDHGGRNTNTIARRNSTLINTPPLALTPSPRTKFEWIDNQSGFSPGRKNSITLVNAYRRMSCQSSEFLLAREDSSEEGQFQDVFQFDADENMGDSTTTWLLNSKLTQNWFFRQDQEGRLPNVNTNSLILSRSPSPNRPITDYANKIIQRERQTLREQNMWSPQNF